jgi:formate hydrogenlyase subunit 6/NADH:ubiquinone oxidoreductase subunit I
MKADRVEKKFLNWEQFSVDYNKCLFCNLCVEVCPKDCIHMDRRDGSAKFALITDDRATLNLDLLTWVGLSEADQRAVEKVAAARAAAPAAPATATAAAADPKAAAAKPAAPGTAPPAAAGG